MSDMIKRGRLSNKSQDETYQNVHYGSSDLWKGEQKIMSEICARVPDNGTIVEIGTWQGGTTRLFYDTTHERGIKVYTVDIAPQRTAYENLRDTDVEIMAKASTAAASQWSDSIHKSVDLLFIDGSHLFHDIFQDFNAWTVHLNSDATIVIHDYDPIERGGIAHLGVQVFVDTLVRLNTLKESSHQYKLFYGRPKDRERVCIDIEACYETFVGLGKSVSSLWKDDYSGWELISDDRFALLLRRCLPLEKCGYTWPPREIHDRPGKMYLVSAHPLGMPLDFMAQLGITDSRLKWIDSLKACYLVDHCLSAGYQALLGLSTDRKEFVKWADAIFTFEYAFGTSLFPSNYWEIPAVSGAEGLCRMISREQVKLNLLARILSTLVDWTP